MSIRKDEVQLEITFITDESKAMARAINSTKELQQGVDKLRAQTVAYEKELKKTNLTEERRAELLQKIKLAEAGVEDGLKKIAAAGKGVEKLDLTKIAPAQLTARAKQLAQAMALIPQSTPQYKAMEVELRQINTRLGQMKTATKGVADTAQAVPGIFSKINAALSTLGLIGLVNGLVNVTQKLFGAGKEMEVLTKKAQVVFGEALPEVTKQAEANANAMGMTTAQYTNASAAIGDLLVPMGFQRTEAANISTELVNLSGALSEWSGGQRSAEEVSKILSKALLGEREELKSLGIAINENDVKQRLASKGLSDATGKTLEQAKAAATLELILEKSVDAQTAYANNADTLVRKQAEMSARFDDVVEKLGTALIPVFNRLLEVLLPVVEGISDATTAITTNTETTTAWGKVFEFLAKIIGTVWNVQTGLYKAIATFTLFVAEKATPVLAFFTTGFLHLYNAGAKAANFLNEMAGTNLRFTPVDIDGFNAKADNMVAKLKLAREEANKTASAAKTASTATGGGGGTGGGGTASQTPEQAAAATKKAFDARLAAMNEGYKQEQLLVENQVITREITEQRAAEKLFQLEKAHLEAKLRLYDAFGKSRTSQALEAANQLAAIQQFEADRASAAAAGELQRLEQLGVKQMDISNITAEAEKKTRESVLEYTQKASEAALEDYKGKSEKQQQAAQELAQRQADIAGETFEALGIATAEFFIGQKKDQKQFLKEILKTLLSALQKQVLVGIANAAISETSKPFPANLFTTAAKVAAINVAFGAARAAVGSFAEGGLTGQRITGQPNITPLANGDNMLAYVRTGEVILNEGQQRALGGPDIFRRIGVPGFADGGAIPNTTPTAAPIPAQASDQTALRLAMMQAEEIRALRADLNGWRNRLKADVSYFDIEDAGTRLNGLRQDASL